MFDSIFLDIVSIDCFQTMIALEIKKQQFFTYHRNGCYEEKMVVVKNLNLIDSNYH